MTSCLERGKDDGRGAVFRDSLGGTEFWEIYSREEGRMETSNFGREKIGKEDLNFIDIRPFNGKSCLKKGSSRTESGGKGTRRTRNYTAREAGPRRQGRLSE